MSTNKISADELKRIKGLGCLKDKRYTDVFNVRVITRNGNVSSDEQRLVAEAADKFGSGRVTLTTRLTFEIQGVPYENLESLFAFLKEGGLETGGTGPKVRPIVSCKGTTCVFGLIDTFALSEKMHERFYKAYHGTVLPHKFKMAVGGCPNNCVKPELNDIGVIGQRIPTLSADVCCKCKKCQVEQNCPMNAVSLSDGMPVINTEICNNCGRCVEKCPFGAMTGSNEAYRVYIGGRWGKKTARAVPLGKIFTSQDEVLDVIERAIILFRDEGIAGERFSDTIARLGFDYVESKLLNP